MRLLLIAALIMIGATTSPALPVHNYPGLIEIIEKSPDVAVIKINARVAGDGMTYDTYKATILQSIKGNIPTEATRELALAHIQVKGSYGSTDEGFRVDSDYLVFLEPNTYTNVAGTHRNIPIIGSCWKFRPETGWKADTNLSLKAQLESLFDQQGWDKKRTEQEAGVVREPRGGSRAPQP